ncbi:MAG: CapA family protein, partial [Gemmatimonadales bacterium]|nr:CapA family protein [Gemmatimonadales bacterium]
TMSFVGDINLGTSTLADGVPEDGGRSLLRGARSALAADLVVGNFEGVLADAGESEKCVRARRPGRCFAFRTPVSLALRLAEAGFTHLNLANNHANDYGSFGRWSSQSALAWLGLRTYGPLGDIAIDTVRREQGTTIVGLIGFTTYPHSYDLLDLARSAAVVDSIRPLVDLLIVTFHGGAEGVSAVHVAAAAESLGTEPRGDLRAWARTVINAGADVVVGHGPHVLRGIEFYNGRPIVYSLGNFLTYRGFSLTGPLGITGVLRLRFAPDRTLASAQLVPMVQEPQRGPRPDPARHAIALVRRLSGEDFGRSGARIDARGIVLPPDLPPDSVAPALAEPEPRAY